MTFWDHLEDLRKSIMRIIAVYVAAVVVLFFFKDFLFDAIILAPTGSDFFLYEMIGTDFSLSLVNLEIAAQFMTHMKVTFACALILVLPYVIFEIWKFVAPALYEREKKGVRMAFSAASILFYVGLCVGYFIIFPVMLNFFAAYQVSTDIPNTFSLSSYMSMFLSTILTFGLVFEFPAITSALSGIGVIDRSMMREYRRHAICAVVILAAVITPSGDPFSLMVCACPLYLLYELSILLCKN